MKEHSVVQGRSLKLNGSEARNMLNAYIYRKCGNENFLGTMEKDRDVFWSDQMLHII